MNSSRWFLYSFYDLEKATLSNIEPDTKPYPSVSNHYKTILPFLSLPSPLKLYFSLFRLTSLYLNSAFPPSHLLTSLSKGLDMRRRISSLFFLIEFTKIQAGALLLLK
jgi:hypothetical protein